MVRIFVSSQLVDHEPAAALIRELKSLSCAVFHSPRNPLDGEDPRWSDWYASGLSTSLARCDRFVVVLDQGWDSSTWMAQEASLAVEQNLETFYWNPLQVVVTAGGVKMYLVNERPRDLKVAAGLLAAPESGDTFLSGVPDH